MQFTLNTYFINRERVIENSTCTYGSADSEQTQGPHPRPHGRPLRRPPSRGPPTPLPLRDYKFTALIVGRFCQSA